MFLDFFVQIWPNHATRPFFQRPFQALSNQEASMATVQFTGSTHESQKDAPEGVTETLEAWLQAAGLEGSFTYRAVDRTKGTGTMASVHAIGVRDGTFVNARIRPEGRGNKNAWMVAIPAPPGQSADQIFRQLRNAERRLSGDEDQLLTSRLSTLYTYLDGKLIDLEALDQRMITSSGFASREELEGSLDALHGRSRIVRKAGPSRFEWCKALARVQVAPLETRPQPHPSETFVLSLTPDERVFLFDLAQTHVHIYDEKGDMQLRLPNELPLFEEEVHDFFGKAERCGLITPIGSNPNGILGKAWGLNFPMLFVCVSLIGTLFPEDIPKLVKLLPNDLAKLFNRGGITSVPPGYYELLERAARLVNQVHGKELIEITEQQHTPPIRIETADGVIEYHRTVSLRLPNDFALHLFNVQGLFNGKESPPTVDQPGMNPLVSLQQELQANLERERACTEHLTTLITTRPGAENQVELLKVQAANLLEQASKLAAQVTESFGVETRLNAELERIQKEIGALKGQIQKYHQIGREEAAKEVDAFIHEYASNAGLDPEDIISELRRRYSI